MPLKEKTYFNWSTGKDAALAFYYLKKEGLLQIDILLTSINAYHNRVSMHGLRRELLEQQAQYIGLPLKTIELPEQPTMEEYNNLMIKTIEGLKAEGYANCGFGDINLEDLKAYREQQLKPYQIKCHFPLWKKDTRAIISEFIKLGFKAIVICIKSDLLDQSFIGREIDESFINDLPHNVDSCGENGEFHTFCYDGPIFKKPIPFTIGDKVYREYKNPKKDNESHSKDTIGFWFCDLIPKGKHS